MMKLKTNLLVILCLLTGFSICSQNIDETYYLGKPMGVGCGSGNILLEMTKKIKIKATPEEAILTLKSLACTDDVKMFGLPPNNDNELATYFHRDKQIALIIYKDNTIALANRDISTEPLIINTVGATDKKKAKSLVKGKVGKTYEGDFSDKRLVSIIKDREAIAEAKAAKENLVDFPDMGFKDTRGIGGVYHLSIPIKIEEETKKYTDKLQIEYLPNDLDNIILYGPLNQKMKGLCQSKKYQVQKNILSWQFNQHHFKGEANIGKVFNRKGIVLLEPGVFFIGSIGSLQYEEKGNVNYDKLKEAASHYRIMAKNKTRLKELMNDPLQVGKLYLKFVKNVKGAREENQMKANPLPPENTAMRNFRTKALTAMRARAKKDRWKGTIEAAYAEETNWRVITHNLTGRILYRQIGCIMIEKKDGKCKWRRFSIKQEYNGSGFNKNVIVNNYSTAYYYAIDCGKASKYK